MPLIGYARVSTEDQRTARQADELRGAGCEEVHEERASGADRQRPVLARTLRRVGRGDTLVVVKLDRLARSLEHLLDTVRGLEAKGAYLRILGDPIDTATPQGRFMLQMLGAVAEFERALIRERVLSGLARAASEGRRGGNPALRARDPDALKRLHGARRDAYLADVSSGSVDWLPLVVRLRSEARTWDDVVRAANAKRAAGSAEWTKARLVRAVRALVQDGLAPRAALEGRGRRQTARARERDAILRVAAGVLRESPGLTLRQVGDRLAALRYHPPRGGVHWSVSSVAATLKRARRAGLLGRE